MFRSLLYDNTQGLSFVLSAFTTFPLLQISQNNIEVDAETKVSTRKTEEKLAGRYKEGHERKKPK
jgi:hypothetical protein